VTSLVTSGENSFIEDTISVMPFPVVSNVSQINAGKFSVQVILKMNT
jgi:hypothetical protein